MAAADAYRLAEALHLSARTQVHRGHRNADDLPVIIKQLRPGAMTDAGVTRLRHEYLLTRELAVAATGAAAPPAGLDGAMSRCWIRPVLAMTELYGAPALIYPDLQAIPLRNWWTTPAATPVARLRLALQITRAVAALHAGGITHRDLSPDHILIGAQSPHTEDAHTLHEATASVQLIDLALATLAPRGEQEPLHPNRLPGDLRYLAPELTGRTGRSFDRRADLYALGAILFEQMAGVPPFTASDPLELIQAHLGRLPPRLLEVAPEQPTALTRILATLLCKRAEDRYQCADDLLKDLERVLEAQLRGRSSAELQPDAGARTPRFSIPTRFYGREQALRRLFEELDHAREGTCAPVLLSGPSGVGKSTLIRSLVARAASSAVGTVTIRADRSDWNTRQPTMIGAFAPLLRRLAAAGGAQRERAVQRLIGLPGASADVLLDVLPELSLLIPAGSAPPVLPPVEAEQRFELAFVRLVAALVHEDAPLLLVIEDHDRLDDHDRRLLALVTGPAGVAHLLVVGASSASGAAQPELPQERHWEHDDDAPQEPPHDLRDRPGQMHDAELQRIRVAPLQPEETTALVADTLRADRKAVRPLADRLHEQAHGIPATVLAILETLRACGLLRYDPGSASWIRAGTEAQLDAALARGTPASQCLDAADPPLRSCLEAAAAVGPEFDVRSVARALDLTLPELLARLRPALDDGLLVAADPIVADDRCDDGHDERLAGIGDADSHWQLRFPDLGHHRQLYEGLNEERRAQLHQRIGADLVSTAQQDGDATLLHEGVSQLNLARQMMSTTAAIEADRPAESSVDPDTATHAGTDAELARLNLQAGRAMLSTSRGQSAFHFLRTGLALLGPDAWRKQEALALELSVAAMKAATLCGDPRQVERLGRAALRNPLAPDARLRIAALVTRALISDARLAEGLELAMPVLRAADLEPSSRLPASLLMFLTLRRGRRLLRLLQRDRHAPEPPRPAHLDAGTALLVDVLQGTWQASASRASLAALLRLVTTAVHHPSLPATSLALAACAAICVRLGRRDDALRFCKRAEQLLADGSRTASGAEDDDPRIRLRTRLLLVTFVRPWIEAPPKLHRTLLELQQMALTIGDVESAGRAAAAFAVSTVVRGSDLQSARRELLAVAESLRFYPDTPGLVLLNSWVAFLDDLEDGCSGARLAAVQAGHGRRADRDGAAEPRPGSESGLRQQLAHRLLLEAWLAALRDEPAQVLARLEHPALRILAGSAGLLGSQFHLLRALADLDLARTGAAAGHRRRARRSRRRIETWIGHGLAHLKQRALLIRAEEDAAAGRAQQALAHFEMAVRTARAHGFVLDEALAWTRAARFCRDTGRLEFADRFEASAHESRQRAGLAVHGAGERRSVTNPGQASPQLSIASALLATADALSWTAHPETLVATSCEQLLLASGAARVALVLVEDNQLLLAATVEAGALAHLRTPRAPLAGAIEQVPVSVVQLVSRTREPLVIQHAGRDDRFSQDPYMIRHRPRAALCVPLMVADRLLGVFYADHPHHHDLFDAYRVELARLLCVQVAIGIENARLYADLARARDEFRGLFEHAAEGIFRIRPDGRLLNANLALAEALGYASTDQLLGELEFLPRDVAAVPEAVAGLLSRINTTDGVRSQELEALRRDGSRVWLEISARTVRDDAGAPLAIEGSVVDTTARRQRLQAERAREVAEAATEAKTRFLASMSHEIRTPMNAIIGFADLALESKLEPRQGEYIAHIRDAAGALLGIINDVLDLSRIEAGRVELDCEPLDVPQLFRQLENLFGTRARAQRVPLRFLGAAELAGSLPRGRALGGDPLRLRQVLVNLTDNALKFTPAGEVEVSARLLDQRPGFARLQLTVRDTGIGIDDAQLARLFTPFEQLDSGTTRQHAGTGLGLAISRQLIELMGGTLGVESRPGAGSIFSSDLELPLINAASAEAGPAAVLDRSTLRGRRILLAEDNRINAQLALEFLESAGAEVTVTETGSGVLEQLRLQAFDAVLMDLHMPDMDGVEACRRLRHLEHGRTVPVIAVTADAIGDGVLRAREAGVDGHVLKPIDRAGLIGTLLRFLPPDLDTTEAAVTEGEAVPQDEAGLLAPLSRFGKLPGLDLERALHNHDGRWTLLERLLGDFQHHYGAAGRQLRELLAAQRGEEAARLAHNLHGVSGSFGAERLRIIAGELEHAIEAGESRLDARLTRFEQALQEALQSASQVTGGQLRLVVEPGPESVPGATPETDAGSESS